MELLVHTEKSSCIVSGSIKDIPLNKEPVKIILSRQGDMEIFSGGNNRTGLQGTLVFPQRFLAVGDFWERPVKLELPYFIKPFNTIVRSTVEKFEYYEESSLCAVINNTFYSSEERPTGRFSGKEKVYFDCELGRLTKISFNMRIISNILGITLDINVDTEFSSSPEK